MSNYNTWIGGDIHGGYKALKQCLERCNFDYDNDTFIQTGDICDGWDEVYECVEELLKIRNLIPIKGNHDDYFAYWLEFGDHPVGWGQGALATLKSYGFNCLGKDYEAFQMTYDHTIQSAITNLKPENIPALHKRFFLEEQKYYHIDKDNNLFIHGGFNRHHPLKEQPNWVLLWDRDLWNAALSFSSMADNTYKFKMQDDFKEIFIGHTATTNWSDEEKREGNIIVKLGTRRTTPMHAANIWNLDTGAGWKGGKLSFMNLHTKEIIQSDTLGELYTDQNGR